MYQILFILKIWFIQNPKPWNAKNDQNDLEKLNVAELA